MKLTHFIAAGLVLAGVGVSTEASARHGRDDGRRWEHRDDRRWNDSRGHGWNDRRHYGWDRGHHRGWDRGRRGWRGDRHCRIVWRYGQRYRICR